MDRIINWQQGAKMKLKERRFYVWELYKGGLSYRKIADQLRREGKADISFKTVAIDVRKVADELNAQSLGLAARFRQVQLERIKAAVAAIWAKVIEGQVESIHVLIRLMEREARLLGLDAPAKVDIEQRIRAIATEHGLDADEAVRESERVVREHALG